MRIADAVVVITGAGSGIGEALAAAVADAHARAIVVADLDMTAAATVAQRLASDATIALPAPCDVAVPADVEALVALAQERLGRIDLFVSNAGIMVDGGLDLAVAHWDRSWSINVMAHVHAARAALPGMLGRGKGHFLNVCSAAAMLTAPGAAPYATTEHAALGFAEWLAIAHGGQGIGVSVLCPEAVRTGMLSASLARGNAGVRRLTESGLVMDPRAVAEAALAGVEQDRFLIASHPRTLANTQRKWSDIDRWIAGMRSFLNSDA